MALLADQLARPDDERDFEWLLDTLQSAIALEHATLPLYLSSMFSLKVQNYTNYNAIRAVVMEEMAHMALVCNMVSALGGSPQIEHLEVDTPRHGLPGGAEPDLEVVLAPFCDSQIKNFMRLEAPDFLLPASQDPEQYASISDLYRAISQAIDNNADEVRSAFKAGGPANQVGDNIGFTTIKPTPGVDPIDQLKGAILEIVEQGEGAAARSLHAPDFEAELSHYGRFAELHYGARYQLPSRPMKLTPETEEQFFAGAAIRPPVVTNLLTVPSDGYAAVLDADPKAPSVEAALQGFDDKYSSILHLLNQMWNGPAAKSWPNFGAAVGAMTELRVLSCFNIQPFQVPVAAIAELESLYPNESELLRKYTDLDRPVFYGARFRNTNKNS